MIKAAAIVSAFCATVAAAAGTVFPFRTYEMRGTYVGLLRCSKCTGIRTEIVLEDPGVNAGRGSGAYTMRQTYIGGTLARKTVLTVGTWFVSKHGRYYQESGVIELSSQHVHGRAVEPHFFNCVRGQKLEALDRAKRPIMGADSTLFRKDGVTGR